MNFSQSLNFDKNKGFVTAIAQDSKTGQVLMVAQANAEAIDESLKTGLATFWSTSRNQLWTKGLTSGNTLAIDAVHVDCDADAVLYLVTPQGEGGACHRPDFFSCFGRKLSSDQSTLTEQQPPTFTSVLTDEFTQLQKRQQADPTESHTAASLAQPMARVAQKIGEEGLEVALALTDPDQDKQTVINESADLLYRLQLGCIKAGINWHEVEAEIVKRRH